MKIINLTQNSSLYTCNVYLVTGSWNALQDLNTLVDVGRDSSIIDKINNYATGIGKHKIDQVILTHSHYDHASLLPDIKQIYHPKTYAYSSSLQFIDRTVSDGYKIKLGDTWFEVIYAPGHSSDSICLYSKSAHVLFSGDLPFIIKTAQGTYEEHFLLLLKRLSTLNIDIIYPGHGPPIGGNCTELITHSLSIINSNYSSIHLGG